MGAPHTNYRPDVDGLRAVAILAVLAYHASHLLLPGGYVGVDVFFVISGYLITGILLRDLAAGQFSIATFYKRRVRRIFPALVTVLAFCWIAGWFALLPDEFKQLGKHIGSAAIFISNLVLYKEAGYFDVASDLKPLAHLWSLGVEEQFYIAWPLMMLAAWHWQRGVMRLLLALFAISIVGNLVLTHMNSAFAFFMPMTRFWELMAGGLLAYAERYWPHRLPARQAVRNAMSALGLTLIVAACVGFTKFDAFPGWRAMVPVAGALLMIAAGPQSGVNKHLLANRAMVWIGLISYPLYLWHWPLLSYARIVESGEPAHWIKAVAVAISVLLAWLTYRFIERPLRFGALGKRSRSLLWLVLALVALALLGLLTELRQGMPRTRQLDLPMAQDMEPLDTFRATLPKCDAALGLGDLQWCYLSREGAPTAALFGDSHADAFFPGLVLEDRQRNWMLVGHSSCPPLKDVESTFREHPDSCREKNDRALEMLAASPNIRTVVLSALGGFYMGESYSPQHTGKVDPANWRLQSTHDDEAGSSAAEVYYEGMARTIRTLERVGKQVIVMRDVPGIDFWPVACMKRPFTLTTPTEKKSCAMDRAKLERLNAQYHGVLDALAKAYPHVLFYDGFAPLCDAQQCYGGKGDTLYYRDTHHLSIRGAKRVAKHFMAWWQAQPANTVPAP